MRFYSLFLGGVLCAAFIAPAVANVATTAGSNLTAYNGTGSTNNNQWNNLTNGRAGMSSTAADANFGNCNAVILRCASPKCANGACTDMNVARPIVAGCVNSNNSCKKHGEDLIEYITAQIVAQSTVKLQEQQNAVAMAQAQAEAQAAASAAAAAQSNAQMQQMQQQMQQMQAQMAESMNAMQQQMAAQTESQNAQIQNALAEQRNSVANVPATQSSGETGAVIAGLEGLGVAEQLAAKNGISADILVREQMGGQIETAIEDAMLAMKDLKEKLDAVLEYAGCDPSATNCTGPKRVKKFKDLANEFFDPYENVVENIYDALILAMTLGIDVNDVIMLLSDSCNMWGKYMCNSCDPDRNEEDCVCNDRKNRDGCYYRVKTDGEGKVAKSQPHCRLVSILNEKDTVWREWIDANTGMTGSTQVACASDVVMNISLFRGRKKQATLDIDNLRRLVNQDSYSCRGKMDSGKFVLTNNDAIEDCGLNMCAVNPNEDSESYKLLYDTVRTRKLPKVDATAKSLCWADYDSAPRSVKNIDPTIGDVVNKSCAAFSVSPELCASRGRTNKKGEWIAECVWDTDSQKCVAFSKSQVDISKLTPVSTSEALNKMNNVSKLGARDPVVVSKDMSAGDMPDISKFKNFADCLANMTVYFSDMNDGYTNTNAGSEANAWCKEWYK